MVETLRAGSHSYRFRAQLTSLSTDLLPCILLEAIMRGLLRVLAITPDSLAGLSVCSALSDDPKLDLIHLPQDESNLLPQYLNEYRPKVLTLVATTNCQEVVDNLQSLSINGHPLPVVVVALTYDEACVRHLLALPASGYVLITEPADLLRYAVHAVGLGSSWFPTSITNRFYGQRQGSQSESSDRHLLTRLTEREVEVLRLLAQGLDNEHIGEILTVSVRTIRFHTRNIYDKLNFKSRGEAIAWAIKAGVFK